MMIYSVVNYIFTQIKIFLGGACNFMGDAEHPEQSPGYGAACNHWRLKYTKDASIRKNKNTTNIYWLEFFNIFCYFFQRAFHFFYSIQLVLKKRQKSRREIEEVKIQ